MDVDLNTFQRHQNDINGISTHIIEAEDNKQHWYERN